MREQGFVGFFDIDETEDDHQEQVEGISHLGYHETHVLREPTREEVHDRMLKIREKVMENKGKGMLTYIYHYYAGAGANDQGYHGQCVILNTEDPKAAYPIERRLWDLAAMGKACVVHCIFDCGRLRMTDGLEGWREDSAK